MKYQAKRLLKLIFSGQLKIHTGQYGEDIVLHKLFRHLPATGYYVDVGAHHPFAISNTSYLWARGWRGVNVDASAEAISRFESVRPDDINICAAVIPTDQLTTGKKITFYFNKAIDNNATCDPEIARSRNLGRSVEVKCTSLKQVIETAKEAFGTQFDLLNIDIEGLDEAAIKDMSGWACLPRVLMIEIYSQNLLDLANNATTKLIISHGYTLSQRMGHTAIFEREISD